MSGGVAGGGFVRGSSLATFDHCLLLSRCHCERLAMVMERSRQKVYCCARILPTFHAS